MFNGHVPIAIMHPPTHPNVLLSEMEKGECSIKFGLGQYCVGFQMSF